MKTIVILGAMAWLGVSVVAAQQKAATPTTATQEPTAKPSSAASPVTPPADYVIGKGDVLEVVYRDEKEISGDRLVRPDGKITIPLVGDVEVAGLSPEQARQAVVKASAELYKNPTITLGVKNINSRMVFINGGVAKPGPYPLHGPMTVLQLISLAGSFREWVDTTKVMIIRNEGGKRSFLRFNYKEVVVGKNLEQDIELKPGDIVTVPEPD